MRKVNILCLIAAAMTFLTLNLYSSIAFADWDPSHPNTKYVQMPDVNNGMDVNATWLWNTTQPPPGPPAPIYPWQKILADDFPCLQTGPITDIHIWGSWLNDHVNTAASFKLSIHADMPAGVDAPYSHPGEELWSQIFDPAEYVSRIWATGNELFYEPNTNQIIGTDTQVWQYNFDIPLAEAFIQQGSPTDQKVYWLDVQAIIPEPAPEQGLLPEYVFGWKTTQQPWNDDAVYGDTDIPGGLPYPQFTDPGFPGVVLPWNDMIYPTGPYQGQSINLAFAITTVPEPSTIIMLLGTCLFGWIAYIRRR